MWIWFVHLIGAIAFWPLFIITTALHFIVWSTKFTLWLTWLPFKYTFRLLGAIFTKAGA